MEEPQSTPASAQSQQQQQQPLASQLPLEQTPEQTSALRTIFNRCFVTVTVVNFFVMLAYYQIMVTTVSFMQERFALSLSTAGASLGAIIIGCLLGRFVSGNIIP